jgi:hypothetical protein
LGGVFNRQGSKVSDFVDVHDKVSLDKQIVEYFASNPHVDNNMIKDLAEKIGMTEEQLNIAIYGLLTDAVYVDDRGRGNNTPIDKNELENGAQHEAKEHYNGNMVLGYKTAKDHLVENPKYYSMLEALEKNVNGKITV